MEPHKSDRRRFSDLFNPRDEEESSPVEEDETETEQTLTEPQVDSEQSLTEPQEDTAPTVRRSTRKKIRALSEQLIVENRPVKLTARSSENEIIKYYLDKKVKRSNLSLETIYEEPQVEEVIMSTRRFRRFINFDIPNNKNIAKIKKRKTKAKKLKAKKVAKVTLKLLMEKLDEIE